MAISRVRRETHIAVLTAIAVTCVMAQEQSTFAAQRLRKAAGQSGNSHLSATLQEFRDRDEKACIHFATPVKVLMSVRDSAGQLLPEHSEQTS